MLARGKLGSGAAAPPWVVGLAAAAGGHERWDMDPARVRMATPATLVAPQVVARRVGVAGGLEWGTGSCQRAGVIQGPRRGGRATSVRTA